jgi:hypothetical protein
MVLYAQIMPRRKRSKHEEEIVFGEKLAKKVVIPGENTSNQVVILFLKLKAKSLDFFDVSPYYRGASFALFVHKQ